MYGPPVGAIGVGGTVLATTVLGAATGRLAVTGLPVVSIVAAALILIVVGLALVRVSLRRRVRP